MSWDLLYRSGRGLDLTLETTSGAREKVPLQRFWGDDGDESSLLDTVVSWCSGPTIDVGCGPGRVVQMLRRRRVAALGLDSSYAAVGIVRRQGGAAVLGDIFDPIPGEGRWSHLLLLDGNVGIGGDPQRLLQRASGVLGPGGTVVVEADSRLSSIVTERTRVRAGAEKGPWFTWARVGEDRIAALAAAAGLEVARSVSAAGRSCIELRRR